MPPPRKVELLPADLKRYLQEALKKRGFAGYEDLAEDLNFRLEEAGQELRIGKSALHAYGQEYAEFVKVQEEASTWASGWMTDNGLKDEANAHNAIFQMVTTLAFKWAKDQLNNEGKDINPLELDRLGSMLKNLMSSSGIREKLKADERARIAKEAREAAQTEAEERFEAVVTEAGLGDEVIARMRNGFLGVRS